MAHLAADIDKETVHNGRLRSAKETGAEICPAIDFERIAELLATSETKRKLGRVNFHKDLWDLYWGRASLLLANYSVPSDSPRRLCVS